ncbi:MAG: hypothetical protein RSG77_17015 [Hafnia sp.]
MRAFKFVKAHWFSIMVFFIALMLGLVVLSALVDGYIWTGGRGQYSIFYRTKSPFPYWSSVTLHTIFAILLIKLGRFIMRFETESINSSTPTRRKKKKE